jgi:hypothetical protein
MVCYYQSMKHISEEELASKLVEATKRVTVGAQYRHYKNKLYKVLGFAILEATNEVGVIYQAQYGHNLIFIRPLTAWLEEVEWRGDTVKRFTKIDKENNSA